MQYIRPIGFCLLTLMTIFLPLAWAEDAAQIQELLSSAQQKLQQADFQGAIEDSEKGLELSKSADFKPGIAAFSGLIGTGYVNRGEYFKSLDYFESALKIHKEFANPKAEAAVHSLISVSDEALGKYAEAFNHLEAALQIHRRLDEKLLEASNLRLIGNMYLNVGEDFKGLEQFKAALRIERELGDRNGEGSALGSMGVVYLNIGNHDAALTQLQTALKIFEETGWGKGQADTLTNIGLVYKTIGQYDQALKYYQAALRILQESGDSTQLIDGNIGDLYLEQKKLDLALIAYSRSPQPSIRVGMFYLALGDAPNAKKYFMSGIALGEKAKDANNVVVGYLGRAESSERLGDIKDALASYNRAIEGLERQRELLPRTARSDFFSTRDFIFPRIYAYEGRCRVAQNASDAFYWSENTKARNFIEMVAAKSGSGTILPEDLDKTEADIINRVASIYKQLDTAFREKDQEREQELQEELKTAQKKQTELIVKLRNEYPEYAAIQYPQPLKPGEITLESDEMAIEYEVTDPYTKVFVLKSGKIVWSKDIPVTREELNKLIQTYRRPFENRKLVLQGGFAPVAGKKLYELLIKPILKVKNKKTNQPLVTKNSKLIVIPDEALSLLPFEALPSYVPENLTMGTKHIAGTGIDWPAPSGVRYVGDDYDIAYAQSATALTLARALKKVANVAGGLFVLADPVFDRSDSRIKGTGLVSYVMPEYQAEVNNSISKTMGVGGTREQGGYFDRLSQTSELSASLKDIFRTGAVTLLGKDASEANLRRQDLSAYKYLVFATHGILDTDIPYIREPALVLNQLGNPKEEDGYLTMSEVMGLKLNAEVVALTACKTGMGRQVSGEGVMGLGRAFQYAGAKNVLVSLWSVAEQSTTMLVESFFKHLKEGKTPREALKLARSEIRAAGYDHPFFWSPFILMGE